MKDFVTEKLYCYSSYFQNEVGAVLKAQLFLKRLLTMIEYTFGIHFSTLIVTFFKWWMSLSGFKTVDVVAHCVFYFLMEGLAYLN